jgi:hypothetical protein
MMPALHYSDTEARLPNMAVPTAGFTAAKLSKNLQPIWAAVRAEDYPTARKLSAELYGREDLPSGERAASAAAFAFTALRTGRISAAELYALQSLILQKKQTLARLILMEVRMDQHDYRGAYALLSELEGLKGNPSWDESVSPEELCIALAAVAWRMGDWETVAGHLEKAYSGGMQTMPDLLLEDLFRLSLYRNQSEDAAAAAALLIRKRPVESTDALLQTLVQQGWTEQALPLYRTAFSDAPGSALLRRRLVALCLREGAVEEARSLARASALEITPRKSFTARHTASY